MNTPSDVDKAGAGSVRGHYVRLDPLQRSVVSDARDVSVLAEEFRNLAFQVEEDSRRPHHGGLVVCVTSPEPATGKTLVSLNLALALCRESDKKVLLLEVDLRQPTLHSYLQGVPQSPGLWQLLQDEADLERAVLSVWGERLEIMLAGASGKVANVMAQRRAAEFLERARTRYDLVILDAPPLLLASGRSAAARADRIVLLVRAGHTRRQSIREALSFLDPEKVMGLVLNAVRTAPDHSYSRYRKVADWNGEAYPPHDGATESESGERPPGKGLRRPTRRWRLLAWLLVALLILAGGLAWYYRVGAPAGASGRIQTSETTRLDSPAGSAPGSLADGATPPAAEQGAAADSPPSGAEGESPEP